MSGPEEAVVEGWCSVEELAQPDMRRLIATALELGWSLWAYEAVFEMTADTDPAKFLTTEFTNWREREQAANLCQLTVASPAEPLLVWCGNGHAYKEVVEDWVPMGWQFRTLSGTDPFVIDQTPTVAFEERHQPWVPGLLAALSETIAAHGGAAGILRDQAAVPWTAQTRLKDGGTEDLAGVSLLRFRADGLVVEERDFWNEG